MHILESFGDPTRDQSCINSVGANLEYCFFSAIFPPLTFSYHIIKYSETNRLNISKETFVLIFLVSLKQKHF